MMLVIIEPNRKLQACHLIQTSTVSSRGKDKTAGERRVAICIYINVAMQCRQAALK